MITDYEAQFNLRKRHPFGRLHLLVNQLQSALARQTLKNSQNIPYGNRVGEKLDIFPAADPNAPVFMFIHGGYFRALDKNQYSYMARPLVRAGCTVVLVNYDLAPTVSVKTIVEENIKAFSWVYKNINRWNGNPQNIVLCGHSVGAFLVAKILENEWPAEMRNAISGAVLLSGLYDLTNMRRSYLNQSVKLTDGDVARLNTTHANAEDFPPVVVGVGDAETDEFIKQSKAYGEKLLDINSEHEYLLFAEKNHYSVSRMLGSKDNDLMGRILSLLGVA